MINALKYGIVGAASGTVAARAVARPQNQNEEHFANRFSTGLALGTLTATPILAGEIAKKKPHLYYKVAQKTGEYIEKAIKYVKSNSFGAQMIDKIKSGVKEISKNKSAQEVTAKITKKLQKFAKSSTAKKGKTGLIVAGTVLLALAGIKTITNYFKKEGAIDQKYKDMEVMNNLLA